MPVGAVKSPPNTIRLAPTPLDIDVNALMWTLGMPTRSSSLDIVAPQRVQVPQVEVRMAAPIWASFKRFAQLRPISWLLATLVPTPQVLPK